MKNQLFTRIYLPIIVVCIASIFSYTTFINKDQDKGRARNINSPLPEIIISMSNDGFTPNVVVAKIGQKVTWKTVGTSTHWPASDLHPTHSFYPKSSITKCGTEEEHNIFDACKGIKPGESYSFVFEDEGEWEYHDHLQSRLLGKIIVTQ